MFLRVGDWRAQPFILRWDSLQLVIWFLFLHKDIHFGIHFSFILKYAVKLSTAA